MSVFASCLFLFFFFKQKTAYEMRISDWSSDVCSSDLPCMVPADTPIAHVDGVFNAVAAAGDYVGPVLFEGRGAGSNPTASAVEIGRAACREKCVRTCRSRWSPYH